ncbi:MAG: tandem-95 repeat protein [Pirellulales bacterium]
MSRFEKRKQLTNWLRGLFGTHSRKTRELRIGRLESLEARQVMAGDSYLPLLGSALPGADPSVAAGNDTVQTTGTGSQSGNLQGEGEAAQDLVAFAKALAAANVKMYGAYWCPHCLAQKQLFEDGAQYLPFVEVTDANRNPTSVATQNNITSYPTWVFADGSRLVGEQSLAALAAQAGIAIPTGSTPTFATIPDANVPIDSPYHVPVDAYDPDGNALTVTVSSSNPSVVSAEVLTGNRFLKISVQDFGDMVFELFESEATLPTSRIIELAQSGFYNNIIFHRVINNFMIQTGDPTGTGSGGSTLGDFDDQFNLNLMHNRSGVLSMAKSSDDTNDSQFFITETATPWLDFNHSVFGQLVEGDAVREAISNVATSSSKPTTDIKIASVSVYTDTENALLRLKAHSAGTATITVTVTDSDGHSSSQNFTATGVNYTTPGSNNTPVAVNAAPFLNPVSNVTTSVNTPVSVNLTSTDREGDAVTYAVAKVSSENFTVTVNPTTGLATVTPPAGFTGTLQFKATVSQSASTTTGDETDSQVISVLVGAGAPTAIDLDTASDTGTSSTDNITKAAAPVFTVSGTTAGATVKLKVGNTVIGQATATGSTTSVTASNVSSLGTGAVLVTATQTINSVESTASPSLTVTFDSTAPAQLAAGAFPSSAQIDQALSVNLSHAEEGSGLIYALVNAPTGMTIDAATGAVTWTPTSSQLGTQSFTLNLTDAAGNLTTQDFSINVVEAPKVQITLQTTDLNGNAITQVATGQQFKVKLSVKDLRGFGASGVFAAYVDVLFDSNIVEPIATNPINYLAPFTNGKTGSTSTPGLINELGAFSGNTSGSGADSQVFAEITFTAKAAGNPNIRTEAADDSGSDILLYGETAKVPDNRVSFGSSALAVGANFQAVNDVYNFDEDSGLHNLSVLSNDTIVGTTTLIVSAVGTASGGGTVAIAADGKTIDYTPSGNFNGAETFTYTARNSDGVELTATVTVQVTDVNDPPVAVNDVVTIDANSTLNVISVLSNDTQGADANATETLRVSSVSSGSQGGTIQVGSSGLNVLYTPKAGFTGTETFTYVLSDGRGGTSTGTVSVTVKVANPPPVTVPDTFTLTEDAAQTSFDVLANDSGDSGETLSISGVGTSAKGSTLAISSDGTKLLYTPATNFAGQEVLTYTVKDSGGATALGTVTFNVTNVNDAPDAVNDTLTVLSPAGTQKLDVLANDTDPDSGDTKTISAVTQPASGNGTIAIAADGKSLNYTPPSNSFTGTFTFTYTMRDTAGLTDTATVSVTANNYTPRDIGGTVTTVVGGSSGSFYYGGISYAMTGTDITGAAVNTTLTADASGVFKKTNAAPGTYTITRDALPFLDDQAETLSVVSAATDTSNLTLQSQVGSLQSQFISIRDFLGSSFLNRLTVAVAPGQSQAWYAVGDGYTGFSNIKATMNADASSLVLTAVNSSNQNVQATLPMTGSSSRVTVSGTDGAHRLLKVRGTASDLGFTVVTGSSTASGEGEASSAAVSSSLVSSGLQGEGEAAPPITIGSSGLNSVLSNSDVLRSMLASSLSGSAGQEAKAGPATTRLFPGSVDSAITEVDTLSSTASDLADTLASDASQESDSIDSALAAM